MKRRIFGLACALMLATLASAEGAAPSGESRKFPDVIDVKVRAGRENRFDFDVTISSPYDTAQRYADGFRVTHLDGTVYGERILLHDDAAEQPFTRGLYGVEIPRHVRVVVVQARDRKNGYGGRTLEIALPGR